MTKNIAISLLASLLVSSLYGAEEQRANSVRKALDSVGKLPQKDVVQVDDSQNDVESIQNRTTKAPRERIHSVRKAIDSTAKVESKSVSIVNEFKHMFDDGKVSGQVRVEYADYHFKKADESNVYATALGGILKYELAELNGFNAAAAVYTSHDISFATGSGPKQNPELSSSKGSFTEMMEAYINYRYKGLNLRAGRQLLDTPLADSDDIRMIQNTFEAYTLRYTQDALEFMAGHISRWQGTDADLDDGWNKTGKNGTNFAGISYNDALELSAWYYNITGLTNAFYLEFGGNFPIADELSVHAMGQYLKESELDNSGYASDIYGAMAEFLIAGLGINIAYNYADSSNGKQSFSGTGGGTLFTSMDTMILDEITQDRKSYAVVSGISYNYEDFNFLYAYGDFQGKSNSLGQKAHVVEQNIGFEYNVNDEFLVAAIYVIDEDKENINKTDYDFTRAQVMVNYNF